MQGLREASVAQLRQWASQFASGSLTPPFSAVRLGLYSHAPLAQGFLEALTTLFETAGGGAGAAAALRLLADERERHLAEHDARLRLVWSGPEGPGALRRDTAVVVRELFKAAEKEVLLVGFAFRQGSEVLAVLAERMAQVPDLQVTCCLNIDHQGSQVPDREAVVQAFMAKFWQEQWPWQPRFPVYYDPRALAPTPGERAAMHAKVVVVDDRWVLITSANFTGQGQHRNIETGVRVDDPGFAAQVRAEFIGLIRGGVLLPATGAENA